jgi:hypothetical protein
MSRRNSLADRKHDAFLDTLPLELRRSYERFVMRQHRLAPTPFANLKLWVKSLKPREARLFLAATEGR